jgi:hypothetical protein
MNRIDPVGTCTPNAVCVPDFADINACVAVAPDHDCQMEIGVMMASQNDGHTGSPGVMAGERQPYRMCNGLYPWFIFKNRGDGNFADTPIIKYQPIPLESDSGDSALTGPGIAGARQAVLDLDGDGLVDGILQGRDKDELGKPWWWKVWLNDGTGGLGPTRYLWPARAHDIGYINGIDSNAFDVSGHSMGLFDINGDGLTDHWVADPEPATTANVALNDGTSFRLKESLPWLQTSTGEVQTNLKPGSEAWAHDFVTTTGNRIESGFRFAHLRPFDIDADGRVDMFIKNGVALWPDLLFNIGGNFSTAPLQFAVSGVEQTMAADTNAQEWRWQVTTTRRTSSRSTTRTCRSARPSRASSGRAAASSSSTCSTVSRATRSPLSARPASRTPRSATRRSVRLSKRSMPAARRAATVTAGGSTTSAKTSSPTSVTTAGGTLTGSRSRGRRRILCSGPSQI